MYGKEECEKGNEESEECYLTSSRAFSSNSYLQQVKTTTRNGSWIIGPIFQKYSSDAGSAQSSSAALTKARKVTSGLPAPSSVTMLDALARWC